MNYSALIQNRKSVREFTDQRVPASALEEITTYYQGACRRLFPDLPTELRIFGEEGREALEGAAGYQSFLIGAPQYLVLAGRRPDGSEIAGDLTRLFAETIVPRFKNPVIVVHYSPDFQTKHPELWKLFVDKMRQSSSMMVYNEEDCIRSLLRSGVDPEDAKNFEHFGCNHPYMPGLERHHEFYGARIGLIAPFLDYLKSCAAEGREPESAEEIYQALNTWLEGEILGLINRTKTARDRFLANPSGWIELTDCFWRDTIKNAQSFDSGGSKYFCSNFHLCFLR